MNHNKILIVSHDAGGAEVVSSWVRCHPEYQFEFCLDGPAVGIFQKKIIKLENQPVVHLEKIIQKSNRVVTGTSWASDIEKEAIKLGKKLGKTVASFLDHWVNYPQRFQYNGQTCLPDEIWVGDEDALRIAQNYFPKEKLKFVPNPYFQDIKDELNSLRLPPRQTKKVRILYVCEPIGEHSRREYGHSLHWGYTEYDALRFFFKKLADMISFENIESVCVRNHPSESRDKYDTILEEYPAIPFKKSGGNSIIDDCVWADWVAGCNSMALVVGLLAGKKVYSCIPPGGHLCSLPQKGIIHLRT